jgi:hypothetical protein
VDFGYCSHDPQVACSNCRTYYVVPGVQAPKRKLAPNQVEQIRSWIGRTPVTAEEEIEVEYLKELLRLRDLV